MLFDRLPLLRSEHEVDSVLSREAAFLANNWLFTGITFATLWGTFFPMFSEIVTGQRISVAAPWFNKVNGPLFLLLLLLMGIGPLLGWRRTSCLCTAQAIHLAAWWLPWALASSSRSSARTSIRSSASRSVSL